MKVDRHYEVIIVGGSYSGLAAGLALGRALRTVLLIDNGNPCNKQTPYSHNFLTQDGKTPNEIADLARSQVAAYPSVAMRHAWATAIEKTESGFNVQLQNGEYYTARKIVFATGVKDLMPAIPGFAACWGISILHCPYCHGYEVRHQTTGILGNGETGFELATLISNWTQELTLYTNGPSTLSVSQITKLQQHGIAIVETEIDHLNQQNGFMQQIVFKNDKKASISALYTRLPFVQHSLIPQSLGCAFTPEGYIKIDAAQRTSIPGVFACGDNTTRMRTVANAVAMGTTTGLMVNRELIEEDF